MFRAEETIGQKIRRLRKDVGLTQKELAEKNNLNESTVRNYELGNRYPDFDTLFGIAMDLNVPASTLTGASLTNDFGTMLAFYYMEEIYGLHPVKVGETYHLAFRDEPIPDFDPDDMSGDFMKYRMDSLVRRWYEMRELLQEGKITQEEYIKWQEKSPIFATYDWDNDKMLFDREAEEYDSKMFDEIYGEDEQTRLKDNRVRMRRNRVPKLKK